ncbi:redoxin family protein [Gemmata sp. JC673]|uniref:Redoxin family protein n=1 Tax=Gemmata algarum TaxID=2975278 RepID=A0ABU5ESN6_9BACT|nr:redoxin family protein [Gemmata algarum]MDY3557652.1 redoxin family protein [Gemmata algarum]
MRRLVPLGLTAAVIAVVAGLVGTPVRQHTSAADPPASTDRLNKEIDNLKLFSADGTALVLRDFAKDKGTVVVFLSFDCPVSNSYAATLTELHKVYSAKGIGFVALVPTDDAAEKITKKAGEFKLPFPVLSDSKLVAAEAFKATVTPEAFVLDRNHVVRYRGRIDNQYYGRMKKNPQITEHDLRDALEAVVAGKLVPAPATRAIGCHIDPKERTVTSDAVTYHRDVAPILQKHCQSCHRPGDAGPFALLSYKQAVNWSADIVHYTQNRDMPPWKPTAGLEFVNARTLTIRELDTLAQWEKNGCPEGDPKDAPAPPKLSDGWRLGQPDLIVEMGEEFQVGPTGKDVFRCFVLPTGLKEDKHVVAYEVKPGNAAVLHHSLNYFDTTGKARKLEAAEKARKKGADETDHGPGYPVAMGVGFIPNQADAPRPSVPAVGILGGWAPGQGGTTFPDGCGILLPKEAELVLQLHYHRTGKVEKDRTKIGFYFAKKPVEKPWLMLGVGGMSFLESIPANEANHVQKGSAWITADANVHSIMPHMHLIGKSIKITMTPPDGGPKLLLEIKDWDYNWQEWYWLAKPLSVKAGTRFDVEGVFDNSGKNPNNPNNPPKAVWFGEETTSEMLFGFLGVTPAGKERVRLSRTELKK